MLPHSEFQFNDLVDRAESVDSKAALAARHSLQDQYINLIYDSISSPIHARQEQEKPYDVSSPEHEKAFRPDPAKGFPGIENSDLVAPGVYRGANPGGAGSGSAKDAWTEERMQAGINQLAANEVKVIVSFESPNSRGPAQRIQSERDYCAEVGIQFVSIPMGNDGPTAEQKQQFLQIIDQAKANGESVFCHCHLGRDRTGFMIAFLEEQRYGVSPEEAYAHDVAHGHDASVQKQLPKLNVPRTTPIPSN